MTTSTARTVTVQAGNQAPNVSLTSPLANQSFTAPASVTLSATASDADGSVAKVEFFQGATLIGSATVAPYSAVWSNVPVGSYSLTAKATDNLGATRSSPAVPITVTGSGPTVLYLHGDHLGTPRVATNEANVVVWRHLPTGEPFGMALPEEDPDGDGRATVINLRFPGQYFDRETPLHYNYFRDYDPGTGRYVQSDPIGLAGGINTYSYVGGNPLSYIDAQGLARCRYSISPPGLVCTPNSPDFNDAGFGMQGSESVFSGNNQCKNNPSPECIDTPKEGPIPPGCYRVVSHESKPGFWRLIPFGWSTLDSALYRMQNDYGIGKKRGGFVLHPGTVSWGCITLSASALASYKAINDLLVREQGDNILCVSK